ncbi:MAG: Na/Pi cotransporter family protein [Coprobacillus sp.]
MELTNVFAMLGGLALFLYGMTMMSNGLEMAAGNKMKVILEKLTANRFLGVIVGALITALIQSSSATTVMTVGFVNAGLMNLQSAVWIIMGANIGTTITGQLIAIDITAWAPVIAFVGVALIAFFKSKKADSFGTIIAGLGILFMGMEMMSTAMIPLRSSPDFVNMVSSFENPLIGILVGAGFTAIIQSSSASVGILQALAMSGVITLPSAIYVLFGQNIGTCITAVLASIGTGRNAKRTTILHLSFNIIGTIIFVCISMLTPFAQIMQSLTPSNIPAQIANVHTVFNVATTMLLLPFGKQLVALAYKILPEKEGHEDKKSTKYLDFNVFTNDFLIGTSAIANVQLFNECQNMLNSVTDNVKRSFDLMVEFDEKKYDKLLEAEDYIDYLNKEIIRFTTNAISIEYPFEGAQNIELFVKTSGDLERIGDHAVNIAGRAKKLAEEKIPLSEEALNEIKVMNDVTNNILSELMVLTHNELYKIVEKVDVIEDSIDNLNHTFSINQLKRLRNKTCIPEHSALFTETLIDFERIGDHGLNIAKSFYKIRHAISVMKMANEK